LAAGKLLDQESCKMDSQCGDGVWIMPLGAHAVCLGAGTRAEFPGRVVPAGRRGQRGKNGFFLLPGSHRRRYTMWRDDEILANRGLHSVLIPVLASTLRSHAQ
jgi:hypothetical protein